MTSLLRPPWLTAAPSQRVMAALGEARFIGGCVRDALLGLEAADIDIATPLPPEQVTERLTAIGARVIPTGLAHGTVTALVGADSRFEITTLRRDLACDGRHAVVAFTDDWQADAARRDFTINALSCTADGALFDPFDGVADLRAGRIRFIGSAEQRILEDGLRLLRFFRFYARFGQTAPDAEALAACAKLAPRLTSLSGERVRGELVRLLAHPRAGEVWALLLAHDIVPSLVPAARRGDRLERLLALEAGLGLAGAPRALVRLAALLETDRAGVKAVAARLRLSRAEREQVLALGEPARWLDPAAPPARLRRALAAAGDGGRFQDLLLLGAAATGASLAMVTAALEPVHRWQATRFPLSGDDVLALGVPAGAGVGALLAELHAWWADQDFAADRAACLAALARLKAER